MNYEPYEFSVLLTYYKRNVYTNSIYILQIEGIKWTGHLGWNIALLNSEADTFESFTMITAV